MIGTALAIVPQSLERLHYIRGKRYGYAERVRGVQSIGQIFDMQGRS